MIKYIVGLLVIASIFSTTTKNENNITFEPNEQNIQLALTTVKKMAIGVLSATDNVLDAVLQNLDTEGEYRDKELETQKY